MNDDRYPEFDVVDGAAGFTVSRRDFLKTAGAGLFLFFTIGDMAVFAQERPNERPQATLPKDFNAFLKIGEDGRVSCFTGKIEMGQGIVTSLAQMLADELDVALDTVDMVMGDTDLCPWDRGTFGSLSTRAFGPALRAAGAEARLVLLQLGADALKVPASKLITENGAVVDASNKRHRKTYAELTKGKQIERHLSEPVKVKSPSDFKIMSTSVLRKDADAKVTGKAKYAGDIRLPGMLYAKILRPPAHGSKLIDVDLTAARQVPGAEVIQKGDFIAVLHKYPDVAESALARIKARFDKPASDLDDKTIFAHLLKVAPEGRVVAEAGDVKAGEREAKATLVSTFQDGYVAHAPMEPHTAVAQMEGTKVTVWASTQNPFGARDEIARELKIGPGNVRVITPFVGGGFGGKTRNIQALEAARLTKLTGKPVQVAWSRKEEFFYDSFRPAAVIKIRSGITGTGAISFWDYHVYFAGERGSQHFYDIPNHSTIAHNASWVGGPGTHPFATGAWRAPGNNTNTFARESQIDIMAAKAGIDPVEFRLRHLKDKKMERVLRTAAQKFNWKPLRAPSGKGFGVACGIDAGSYVASMAEVRVDKSSGNVSVKRVVCAQDMGLAVNPEGATIQMEGCITMGLGYALREHVRFKGGEILDLNFDTYQLPRFSWLPTIETVIIDDKEADPQGGGEPAIVTMGALIANAIYDAVGSRVFELPLTPDRVKEGMNKG